ncbi:MAG: methyltransferase domain-containing protein [Chloroflexi bacterium]|nr:methyltransferase domain-containing protein [Chloroflexota bacterium]
MFSDLERINRRPAPFATMTIRELWADPHISEQLLRYHLDDAADGASRPDEFAERSVRWITRTFDLGPGSAVLDLGCGPGQYTNRLARTGAAVTGVDFSPRSIEHARAMAQRDGLEVTHHVADYLEWESSDRFDLALMIYGDYGAMSPEQRGRLLARLADLLEPGGVFLFDAASVAAIAEIEETSAYAPRMMNGFWSAEPYFGFLNTFVYPDARVSLDRYEIVERDRSRTFWTWTQYFDVDSLRAELADAGFSLTDVHGDVTGAPFDPAGEEFAVVARRSGQTR